MSNKPAVSKAVPLSTDLKAILLYNAIAIVFMVVFGILGLFVAATAVAS